MATDDPIENRLLLGDTDFRKSNAVLGSLLKWGTVATEEQEKLLQNMKIQLQQLEFNVSKTDLMVAMEEEEAANFRVIYSDIEQQIAQAHKDIEEEQSRLVDEKIIQRNKQEYDALAGVIEQHPARKTTIEETAQVQAALEELAQRRADLDAKLDLRNKQFHLLLHAAKALQDTFEDEMAVEEKKKEADADESETPMET